MKRPRLESRGLIVASKIQANSLTPVAMPAPAAVPAPTTVPAAMPAPTAVPVASAIKARWAAVIVAARLVPTAVRTADPAHLLRLGCCRRCCRELAVDRHGRRCAGHHACACQNGESRRSNPELIHRAPRSVSRSRRCRPLKNCRVRRVRILKVVFNWRSATRLHCDIPSGREQNLVSR